MLEKLLALLEASEQDTWRLNKGSLASSVEGHTRPDSFT
jgi:hypothetical protein